MNTEKQPITGKEAPRSSTLTIQRLDDNLGPLTTPVISKPKREAGLTVTTRIPDKEKFAYVISEIAAIIRHFSLCDYNHLTYILQPLS